MTNFDTFTKVIRHLDAPHRAALRHHRARALIVSNVRDATSRSEYRTHAEFTRAWEEEAGQRLLDPHAFNSAYESLLDQDQEALLLAIERGEITL